jgi:F-type H+-transporting ATPase subunit b
MTEPWSFLIKLVNFAVMLGLLLKFAAKPFKNFLQGRHNAVKEKVDEAERLLREAKSLKSTYETKLAQLDEEMELFRKASLEEAEREKSKIIAEARSLADRIRQQAQLAYDQEMKDAMAAVQAQIARRTLDAAENAVKQIFKEEDHNRMVDEFIDQLRGARRH